RVRPEGDHGGRGPSGAGRIEDPPVAEMDAVEAPDRDGTLTGGELFGTPGDPHSRASASSGGMNRSGSASSTVNGPISVRRSVRQCPPRTSAMARTYVPELTRRSSCTESPVYAMTSSASTRERRVGISTATPRPASLEG